MASCLPETERHAAEKEDGAGDGSPSGTERSTAAQNGGPPLESGEGGAGWVPRAPDEAPRRRFQIPRKSREKKALQLITSDSREFEEILKILHSSFLDTNSKASFSYTTARLAHNEFLEKEFTEKRRKLKCEGRLDKELVESCAFLMVSQEQAISICEKGLHIGHSKLSTLGKPAMGVYLSRFADLLQTNPLEPGANGHVLIFKVIKGKIKYFPDYNRNNQMEQFSLDPAPNHECHVFKNTNAVTSLLSYRAFERTQYYFYEYRYAEIFKRPSHVCPYAVVSFVYKEDQMHRQPSSAGSIYFSTERQNDRSSFTLWRGQLCSKGQPLCFASLKSHNGPFFPYRLPEKLDLDTFMNLDQIKKRIPSKLFYRETHNKANEVIIGGMYSRLYEVVDFTRTGSVLQNLLQKLDRENLALVKPLVDRGFMFFFFPTPMTASYNSYTGKARFLHTLFVYRESREIPHPDSPLTSPTTLTPESEIIMPELKTFIASVHFAIHKSQLEKAPFNESVEKHSRMYLMHRAERSHKFKEYIPKAYDHRLDAKKSLYTAPKNKGRVEFFLRNYTRAPEDYTLTVERAKEIIQESQRFQQFSPVSDYEPTEDSRELSKYLSRKGSVQETSSRGVDIRVPDHSEYELDKINGLINLIQSWKQNANSNPGYDPAEDGLAGGVKRKLESGPESQWKHFRSDENFHENRDEPIEVGHSMSSFISALGGQDTDLRKENSETPITDSTECLQLILENLNNSGFFNSPVAQSLSKILALQQDKTENETVVNHEEISLEQDTVTVNSRPDESVFYDNEGQQGVEILEGSMTVVPQAEEESLKAKLDDLQSECLSPCPSTPTENVYNRSSSNSGNVESEMHWKLIPITGLNVTDDQLTYVSAEDAYPEDPRALHRKRRRSTGSTSLPEYRKGRSRTSKNARTEDEDLSHSSTSLKRERDLLHTKHCPNGLIENTVLEVYNQFSERLYEVLRQKDVLITTAAMTPLLSSDERSAKLSSWLSEQANGICVNEYVEELREKLSSVVALAISSQIEHPLLDPTIQHMVAEPKEVDALMPVQEISEGAEKSGPLEPDHESGSPECHENGMPPSSDQDPLVESNATKDQVPLDTVEEPLEKPASSPMENATTTNTALADLINQMHPEVFHNLVKIFTHVNKNIVKFYIHVEEENTVCEEIKDYLLKLGNAQCDPDNFLSCDAASDKLLIIIQNEDIERCIHKIPRLIKLKTLPCVSFAGVDTLDDLKNHTYNELFVSGGFIVSDETVLNPESMTVEALKKFLTFLEEITSPEGKWQWKIHCKFQKKLKELGRLNTNASNILTLLNTYQKKHVVEILSYHNCDSQTRQAPELECLIRLQVQNIQQRHIVFLTEKDTAPFLQYSDSGIVVAKMGDFMSNFASLVGFHSSNPEESCLSQLASQEDQTVPKETDVKDEDDMSIDSEDEPLKIEVGPEVLKPDSCTEEANKPPDNTELPETASSTVNVPEKPNESNDVQPVIPVTTTSSVVAENRVAPVVNTMNSFPPFPGPPLGLTHQFSHFNVLTHQTFLGAMYPILANQPPPPLPPPGYFMNSYNPPPQPDTKF
uniref:Transcription activation suppressor n=1 Tax=Leptobrachium leishanense TaxID=445787 RepID=A0A8C5R6W3_9ANUR